MSEPRIQNPAEQRIARVLRQRIKDAGHTQTSFASAVDRGQSWVSSHFLVKPSESLRYLAYREPETFQRIVTALKWTPAQLNAATGLELYVSAQDVPEHAPTSQYTEVPLTRRVLVYPAGTGPAWDLEEALEPLWLPADLYPGKNLVGLKAMSASMEPYLPEGSTAIIVHDDGMVEPGDFCGIRMSDDGVVVKRFVRELDGGLLLLESLNPGQDEEPLFTAPLGSRVIGPVVRRVLDG